MLFLPDFPRVTPLYLGGHTDILEEPDIIEATDLSIEEFDTVDNFLLQQGYVEGTFGGLDGRRWLTGDGIEFYEHSKDPQPNIQIGPIFQGSIEQSKIQAFVSAFDSDIQQAILNVVSRDGEIDKAETILSASQNQAEHSLVDNQESLQTQLVQHQSNLNKLNKQAAIFAIGETPLHLLNKIENEEKEIDRIKSELGYQ